MKRLFLTLAVFLPLSVVADYNDHRGKNVDSLEQVVAKWTPEAISKARESELVGLDRCYRDLMIAYSALNGPKMDYYARQSLKISRRFGWHSSQLDALRYIGMGFYGDEKYDSAIFYYNLALKQLDLMEGGAVSSLDPEGYSEVALDDMRSSMFGTLGNLYNMMDSLPLAMDYYDKAAALFDKHGWNNSNSVLYYNIGETWMDEGDLRKAKEAYEKALSYAETASDSLLTANAKKGLGRLYMEKGRHLKALRYLHEADEYYIAHEREELKWREETFEYMSETLKGQRRLLVLMIQGLLLIALLTAGILSLARRLRASRKEQRETSDVMEETLEDLGRSNNPGEPRLSDREKAIISMLADGRTTPQIAEALFLSAETIKWYRKKLLVKFDVSNTVELVVKAKERGLL